MLSLFSEPEFSPAVKASPKAKKTEVKKSVPIEEDRGFLAFRELLSTLASKNDFKAILEIIKYDSFKADYTLYTFPGGSGDIPYKNSYGHMAGVHNSTLSIRVVHYPERHQCSFVLSFVYVTEGCETFVVPVQVTMDTQECKIREISVMKAKKLMSIPENPVVVQDREELIYIISRVKPYVGPWLDSNPDFKLDAYVVAPWLETLNKAGYVFTENILKRGFLSTSENERQIINRLCQAGNSPKDIFKTTSAVIKTLKNDTNLSTWDVFRRMCKKGVLSDDSVKIAYDRQWNDRYFEYVNRILGKQYKGKRVFTWDSLVNYLMRVDMYEAIDDREALPLLYDYISMCLQLGMEPRTDGDSLKREHDIAARLMREKKDPALDERIRKMVEDEKVRADGGDAKLALCNYSDGKYFIRPAAGYDDLIDEATQQHSCVACYGRRIAEGKTRIFFMREVANPGKSLITVEVDPDLTTIRQKAKECNHSIRDKEQTEFLENWIRMVKAA